VEEQRYAAQARELNQQKAAEATVFDSKQISAEQEAGFLEQAKDKLVLLSPIDGFVENVFVYENEVAPQYKVLAKVNPKKPSQAKGFLPESASFEYHLGDKVSISSLRRPDKTTTGILIGSTPQLIELPMRLRKLQSVSSWGREIFIKLPDDNDFFIGEKITIRLQRKD
jgi:hypothetical protein